MFYTYLYFRADATPYYVGKGLGNRAFRNHSRNVDKPKENSRIFIQYWESEEKALEMERWYISFFGRKDNGTGVLRNLTDGGENPPNMKGIKFSEEHKKKIGEAQKGEKGNNFGKHLTQEVKEKMSAKLKDVKHSPEHTEKIATSRIRNQVKCAGATSSYVGVSRRKKTGKWMANIYINSKTIHLGDFFTEEEAARKVEDANKERRGTL